ncbi:MAG: imidazole glycerol phosphate synthase subunit HisH [Xanthomonadales bacterium]|nr:imidazole glycerol phosphate synthase subunit HisH [Xanthomonadales bacterium]
MSAIVVVDSGVANIGSVVAALERAGAATTVSRDWDTIRAAPRVLLPGVGAAAAAMRELRSLGLAERLPTLTQPVLGICLGMQLLFEGSEEGAGQERDWVPGAGARERSAVAGREPTDKASASDIAPQSPAPSPALLPTPCLSILPGAIRRLTAVPGVRIPHMGWNALLPRRAHPLVAGLDPRDYAYFVHSYAAAEDAHTLMACEHGQRFAAIVARANFMGAQFHPERSAAVGALLLRNFLALSTETLATC